MSGQLFNGGMHFKEYLGSPADFTVLPWEKGFPGKGILLHGNLYAWRTANGDPDPHHDGMYEYATMHDVDQGYYAAPKINISPDGTIEHLRMGTGKGQGFKPMRDADIEQQIAQFSPDFKLQEDTEAWEFGVVANAGHPYTWRSAGKLLQAEPWEPGSPGKAWVDESGNVVAWKTNGRGLVGVPHHGQMTQQPHLATYYDIYPDGTFVSAYDHNQRRAFDPDTLLAEFHPALKPAGDEWHFGSHDEDEEPDWDQYLEDEGWITPTPQQPLVNYVQHTKPHGEHHYDDDADPDNSNFDPEGPQNEYPVVFDGRQFHVGEPNAFHWDMISAVPGMSELVGHGDHGEPVPRTEALAMGRWNKATNSMVWPVKGKFRRDHFNDLVDRAFPGVYDQGPDYGLGSDEDHGWYFGRVAGKPDPRLPVPPEPTDRRDQLWKAVSTTDGQHHVFFGSEGSGGESHIGYMMRNGISPEQVYGYWAWNPYTEDWEDLNRFQKDYKGIYDEVQKLPADDWYFGKPTLSAADPDDPYYDPEFAQDEGDEEWIDRMGDEMAADAARKPGDSEIAHLLDEGVKPGERGKGLRTPDGQEFFWRTEGEFGWPHHDDVARYLGLYNAPDLHYLIVDEDGTVTDALDFQDDSAWTIPV